MSEKKVALFIPRLSGGGAERVFVNYANGFSKKGFQVHLIVLKGGVYEEDLDSDIDVHKLNVRMRYAIYTLVRKLRDLNPNVVISGLPGANIVSMLASSVCSIEKRWITVHNYLGREFSERPAKSVLFRRLITKVSAWMSNGIISVSSGLSASLKKSINVKTDKIYTVHNPIDYLKVRKMSNRNIPKRLKKEIAGREFVVGAGRLTYQKGFDRLVKAFKTAFGSKTEVCLIILGEGPKRVEISDLARKYGLKDRVFLPGFMENPYSFFSNASFFALSSRWEGFALVCVEALACGTPALAFDCPNGPREILANLSQDLLVQNGNIAALAERMKKLYNDGGPSSKKCIERAECFSVERCTDKLAEVVFST